MDDRVKEQCSNCWCWRPEPEMGENMGTCRHDPPVVSAVHDEDNVSMRIVTFFPRMPADGWCSCWTAGPPTFDEPPIEGL